MANLKTVYKAFDYDDVRLLPRKSILKSRSHADTTVEFGSQTFKLPVIPSNMSSIIDEELALWLAANGYFYVMHRFDVDPIVFTMTMHEAEEFSSISLGVGDRDYKIIDEFVKQNITPEYVTVDVAHGHAESVANIVRYLKEHLSNTFVIAGNVGTVEGADFLANAGADAVKVGIGPGRVCTTAPNTGFGTRDHQLSSIQEIYDKVNFEVLIVADGGIRTYGDIAKSIAFGADMVMIGGMFAGHAQSPGELIKDEEGNLTKRYFGSASAEQKGNTKHVEGKSIEVAYKGPIEDTLSAIQDNLQSSISYGGGVKLNELRDVEYTFI